jgi:hypothetical protein
MKIIKNIKKYIGGLWKKFIKLSKKQKIIFTAVSIAAILAIIFIIAFWVKILRDEARAKSIYEVAVVVRDQNNADPAEDARTSLKAGDVLVVQKTGHSWSNTERISYLILKMNLTKEEASKIVQPEERKQDKKELSKEKERLKNIVDKKEKKRMEKEIDNRKITVKTRQYRINLEKYFKGFNPMTLLNQGQPYSDKTFDWRIVEKK